MEIKIKKFQDGGAVEDPNVAPAPEQGAPAEQAPAPEQGGAEQNPLMQIAQVAAQALQNQDCQAAMQVCQAFIQLLQQSQGGGAPAPEQGEPVYRRGGKLVRRIRK